MASGTGIFSKERHLLILKSFEHASNALILGGANIALASYDGANQAMSSWRRFSSALDPMCSGPRTKHGNFKWCRSGLWFRR